MTEIKELQTNRPTFEEAYRRLEEISRKLEDGSTPLETSFELYEEGRKLIALCQKMLDEAERKITLLKLGPEGVISEEIKID